MLRILLLYVYFYVKYIGMLRILLGILLCNVYCYITHILYYVYCCVRYIMYIVMLGILLCILLC